MCLDVNVDARGPGPLHTAHIFHSRPCRSASPFPHTRHQQDNMYSSITVLRPTNLVATSGAAMPWTATLALTSRGGTLFADSICRSRVPVAANASPCV